ncbi:MAG: hypothetical protein ACC656_13600, partial [Candidatus Heimdallarchaeota archaeon]
MTKKTLKQNHNCLIRRKLYILYSIFTIILSGCNTSTIKPDLSLLGFDFYPLKVGQTRVYQVEEINYNLFGNHDTLRYQLRETIDSSYVDQTGE